MDKSELAVSAPDDHTFVVQLTYNCPYFKEICAFPCTYPVNQKVVEANPDWTQSPETYVSNGPMKLSSWEHNAQIVMGLNENYHDVDSITINSLTFKLMDDQRAMLTAFNNGELDFINAVPVDEMASLLVDGSLIPGDYLGSYYVDFNNAKAPFDDPKVRRAFNLVMDRNFIVENVCRPARLPADAWVPYGIYDVAGPDGDDFRTTAGVTGAWPRRTTRPTVRRPASFWPRPATPMVPVSPLSPTSTTPMTSTMPSLRPSSPCGKRS